MTEGLFKFFVSGASASAIVYAILAIVFGIPAATVLFFTSPAILGIIIAILIYYTLFA